MAIAIPRDTAACFPLFEWRGWLGRLLWGRRYASFGTVVVEHSPWTADNRVRRCVAVQSNRANVVGSRFLVEERLCRAGRSATSGSGIGACLLGMAFLRLTKSAPALVRDLDDSVGGGGGVAALVWRVACRYRAHQQDEAEVVEQGVHVKCDGRIGYDPLELLRARKDSNLRPSASEADTLSS